MTPWTVAHQAPLSTGIVQARILERVAIPSDLPHPGTELTFPSLEADSLPLSYRGSPYQSGWSQTSGAYYSADPQAWCVGWGPSSAFERGPQVILIQVGLAVSSGS